MSETTNESGAIDRTEFVKRLRIAFDHDNNASIARRLGTTDATIKNYTDGKYLPVAEMLLRITVVTGINLHWLLTGEGPRRVERDPFLFSPGEEELIRGMARASGRTFEEEVRVLTLAAAQLIRTVG